MRTLKDTIRRISTDDLIYLLVALLFGERMLFCFAIGPDATFDCDDVAYIQSGIIFAKTGIISIWSECPTALIMPGMPVLTGILSLIFGEGAAYIAAIKIVCIIAGSVTAYFIFKTMRLFLPSVWALFAASALLAPNRVWIDNVASTESLYLLFFCANLYYMVNLKWDKSRVGLIKYTVSFLLALLFRANILVMPVFCIVYMFLCKSYSRKEILRRALVFVCMSMVFFVPWTVRNYLRFNAFVPVSYGAGNPTLKGTYQGDSCPADDELDYEENVYSVIRQRYSRYINENGEIENDAHAQYVYAMTDALKARYRMEEWFHREPYGFLQAYLVEKPMSMLAWIYYWGPHPEQIVPFTKALSKINFCLCVVGFILSFVMKQKREIVLFLSLIYWVNLYIIALSFAVERYAALLMPMRWMVAAVALYLIECFAKQMFKRWQRAEA